MRIQVRKITLPNRKSPMTNYKDKISIKNKINKNNNNNRKEHKKELSRRYYRQLKSTALQEKKLKD